MTFAKYRSRSLAKDFYKRNDLTYTEDNVLIYNLYLYNLPRKTSCYDLKKYFRRYGDVKEASLIKETPHDAHSLRLRVGYVNFKDPLAAATVLQREVHMIYSKRFFVKPSDSWRQPNAGSIKNVNPVNYSPIMRLNDDCLIEICKKLSIHDQVSFASSCIRFADILRLCSQTQHRVFALENIYRLTVWEQRIFLTIVGPQIKKFIVQEKMKHRRLMDFILHSCANVTCLHITACMLRPFAIAQLVSTMRAITELELKNCSLCDKAILHLSGLPNLIKLSLTANLQLTGKYLNYLRNLQYLNLDGCAYINMDILKFMFRALAKLQTFSFRGFTDLSRTVCEEMVIFCHNLESLTTNLMESGTEIIAQLPNLKHLEIFACGFTPTTILSQLFYELTNHKADKLLTLKIHINHDINAVNLALLSNLKELRVLEYNHVLCNDRCLYYFRGLKNLQELVILRSQITKYGLLGLLNACKHLRFITIYGHFEMESALSEIITLLRTTKNRRVLPVTFQGDFVDMTFVRKLPDYICAYKDGIISLRDAKDDAFELFLRTIVVN